MDYNSGKITFFVPGLGMGHGGDPGVSGEQPLSPNQVC